MRVAILGEPSGEAARALCTAIAASLHDRGHATSARMDAEDGTDVVLNVTEWRSPTAHWSRRTREVLGVTLLDASDADVDGPEDAPRDILRTAYPALIRTLANAVVAITRGGLVLVTPELGVRPLTRVGVPTAPDAAARAALDAVLPLAGVRWAIENVVREDLPPALAESEGPRALAEAGRRMAAWDLLPSPVALDDLLDDADRRLLRALYGLQQVSYGNCSTREGTGGFWMSGRGVDKSRLEHVGRDVVLVADHDEAAGAVTIRVPPGHPDARVSVDALEHALLYEAFPDVGAVLHVHAWIPGVDATRQSWPCGTVELAREVHDLVGRQDDPANAEVGLRNHGLTLTGPDLPTIFARVEGRLEREVPAA